MFSCFLSHAGAFWGALLAIILVVMAFNVITFVCTLIVLNKHMLNHQFGGHKTLEGQLKLFT